MKFKKFGIIVAIVACICTLISTGGAAHAEKKDRYVMVLEDKTVESQCAEQNIVDGSEQACPAGDIIMGTPMLQSEADKQGYTEYVPLTLEKAKDDPAIRQGIDNLKAKIRGDNGDKEKNTAIINASCFPNNRTITKHFRPKSAETLEIYHEASYTVNTSCQVGNTKDRAGLSFNSFYSIFWPSSKFGSTLLSRGGVILTANWTSWYSGATTTVGQYYTFYATYGCGATDCVVSSSFQFTN